MEKDSFSSLIELFSSIDVKEKGVESIYDYLLKNHTIENPKELADSLGLSMKRIYKVFSLLKQYELIQVYDRPMKITINDPISAWEKLLSEKITKIRMECDNKIEKCEKSFADMKTAYKLFDEQLAAPPVEYINISDEDDPFDFIKNEVIGTSKEMFLTKGIKHQIKFIDEIMKMLQNPRFMKNKGYSDANILIQTILKKMSPIKYKILISKDYAQDILNAIKKFSSNSTQFDDIENKYEEIWDIKICEETFGDFIILDGNELIQFSIDPNNKLLGIFISRNQEITEIFMNKFNEIYTQALDLAEYFKEINLKRKPTLFDKFIFSFY